MHPAQSHKEEKSGMHVYALAASAAATSKGGLGNKSREAKNRGLIRLNMLIGSCVIPTVLLGERVHVGSNHL